MSLKKILAVLLCVAAVFSVMTVVAVATQAARVEVQENAPLPSAPTEPTEPTTEKPNPIEWAQNTWEKLQGTYNVIFDVVQKVLLFGFRFIIWITGGLSFMKPTN